MRQTLLVIDGDHLLFRNIHQLGQLSFQGKQTGGFYGFIGSLNKVINNYSPDRTVICWGDRRENLWRRKKYPEYKAKRKPTEVNFAEQLNWLTECIGNIGVEQLLIKTYEADDLIAHIVTKQKRLMNIIILTGDKDLRQLVTDSHPWVRVLSDKKGESTVYDETKVFEEHGVFPHELTRLLSIVGDKSDNIPGVPGVGEKTALKYMNSQASQSEIEKIDNCTELELWEELINIRNLTIEEVVNEIPEYPLDFDVAYDVLVKTGCKNGLHDKLLKIRQNL